MVFQGLLLKFDGFDYVYHPAITTAPFNNPWPPINCSWNEKAGEPLHYARGSLPLVFHSRDVNFVACIIVHVRLYHFVSLSCLKCKRFFSQKEY